jgi:glycosyltransferase involved in cell wall biosynthesis
MTNNCKINVLMTTYNLEKYVEESILSVLNQITNYTFNLIILDDCSTDNTIQLINQIVESHPKGDVIELHINENNLGVLQNSKKIFELAKAPYIAMIDGDDYWTDKRKIQMQCEFLENHPDYNSSCSLVESYYVSSGLRKTFVDGWHRSKKEEYVLQDYLTSSFSQTSSYFFRNTIKFPEWYENLQSNDATIFCLATGTGKIKYFKQLFSVYRINPTNYSSKKTPAKSNEKTRYFLNKIDEYFEFKYHKTIKIRLIINNIYLYLIDGKNKVSSFFGKTLVVFLFLINKYLIKNKC